MIISLGLMSTTHDLPTSLNALHTLRVLDLSNNQLSGELPRLKNLANLQVLNLENNTFGPHFPSLPTKLVSLVLRNNSFRLSVPSNLSSFYLLQRLDLSLNSKRVVRASTRSIIEHVSSANTSKLLTDARYILETMKMGANLPAYRTLALDEPKEATKNFDESSFTSEGPHG
ncbi:hypothetical protein GYH30_031599 [Glycine max]|uniref:Uncharacterized protein n=1 Tax=Glycine max TaxID=3847 RepID=A0A0R0HSM1_SOYBN|nr:hypothetical protein GYH30_031599 [Glycine max]